MLRWHYRSRDGRLIAFSNNHIYGEALTAFPGTALESPLTLHELDLPPASGRSTRSHPAEVDRVVDLILEHARQRPEQSLGVIAFGPIMGTTLRRRCAGVLPVKTTAAWIPSSPRSGRNGSLSRTSSGCRETNGT